MKKKIEVGTVIFIVIVAIVLSAITTYMYLTSLMPSLVAKESFYDKITEVENTIKQRYVGDVDDKKAMESLLYGYVSGVDKYSTYLNADDYATYMEQLDGKYSGIGITTKYISSSGLLQVVNVNSNSPAQNANIKAGDLIVKIGEKDVSSISYDEAISLLRAEIGTEMTLVVMRDEKEITKKLTVAQYQTSSIEYKMLLDDIGYVYISEFSNTTFDDFKKAVETLETDGAQKFVFDVRNNSGGSLTSVVKILDYLLPQGKLVTLKDKAGNETEYSSNKDSFDKEYTVIINGSTYSGGELFAAAIKDFKAAKLIGKTTYGKGYAQEIIPLSEGAIYLSTKLYYPPSGENYEGVGVAPDIEIDIATELENNFYNLEIKDDTQLAEALKTLGKTIESEDADEQPADQEQNDEEDKKD